MIELSLTEGEELIKKSAADFLKTECPKEVMLKLHAMETGFTPELWKKIADNGWLGIIIPEQYGGSGNNFTSAGVLFGEFGRRALPGPYFSSGILSALVLMEAGSSRLKKDLLPAIAQGKAIATVATAEREYSWSPAEVKLRAAASGNGFVLDGAKLFVEDASAATHFIVAARTARAAAGASGVTLFLVDRKQAGVSVRSFPALLGGTQHEIKFSKVAVDASRVIGKAGQGWEALQNAAEKAAPILCAYMVGGCEAVFSMSVEYSQTRMQFGTPIGRFQRIQDHIIEIVDRLDAAKFTTYEALSKLDAGKPAAESAHVAKAAASDGYFQATTEAQTVHGGIGYSWEYGLTMHTKMSRFLYNYLGSPSEHKRMLARLMGIV